MMQNSESVTLTVDEAHALIGKDKISRGAFYAAINRREVPHIRLGKRILIPRNALNQWLEVGKSGQ
jgi:excisionase family DNA binding protein